jgi:hypothetical protein
MTGTVPVILSPSAARKAVEGREAALYGPAQDGPREGSQDRGAHQRSAPARRSFAEPV